MPIHTHRIRRLRCLVSTSSQVEAFAIRQCLHDRASDTLIPAFESAFDKIAGGDRVIHIPKLELHLKVSSFPELLEVLPELIQQQLNEQLQSMNWETIPITQPQVIWQEATVQQNEFATLLHYLQTGSVPWLAAHAEAFEIAVDLKETCHQQRSQLMNYLSQQPQTAPFYFRLLQLLPETESFALVNTLLDGFSLAWRTAITEFIRFVLDTKQTHLNRHTQCQIVTKIILECLSRAQQHNKPDFSSILDSILFQAGIERNAFINLLPADAALLFEPQPSFERPATSATNAPASENQEIISAGDEATRSPLNPDAIDLFEKTSVSGDQATRSPLNPDAIDLFEKTSVSGDEAMRSPLNPDAIDLFENRKELSNHQAEIASPPSVPPWQGRMKGGFTPVEIASTCEEFPLFVNYAGLVLIHPFISSFFEATGVKETNSKAIADSQIARAAALLHFLATGQAELYEYELGLIKILLGLEPETPLLVGEGLIQQSDQEEAEAVLQSVINYWSVLKSTSIDGLRSSFLQRSGLLRKTENGWTLQVEHQSFDMLLEHLPWSISIIKLSWMKQPLYTEWQTF